jgi:protein-S-isoprenylcysteine O-methyltransferase Ste14
MGVNAAVLLIKRRKNAYRYSVIALLLGTLVNAVYMYASRALRGSSMPVDMVLDVNAITLLIFLLIRIPGIWQGMTLEEPETEKKAEKQAAAISLGSCGLLFLTVQFLMAPTHSIGGINYADVWHAVLTLLGLAFILGGMITAIAVQIAPLVHKAPEEVNIS